MSKSGVQGGTQGVRPHLQWRHAGPVWRPPAPHNANRFAIMAGTRIRL